MVDHSELVKALRYCSTTKGMVYCNVNCKYGWEERSGGCKDILMTDAAAAIEDMAKHITEMHERVTVLQIARGELEAEVKRLEPKRGEWIVKGANRIDCSVCGHSICFTCVLSKGSLTGYNYCPHCGAKMEVQDGQE